MKPISGRRQCNPSKCEMSWLGRVPPSAGRVVINRKACYLSLLAQAAVWLLELRVSHTFLYILRFICSCHGYPAQRATNTSCPRSDRFWLLELPVSRTFLDQLRPQLFRPWIPNSARGIDGGPRRFTEVVLNEQSLPVAGFGEGRPTPPFGRPWVSW